MDIALCASFLEGDIWAERLVAAAQYKLQIDEFNDTDSLLEAISQKPYYAVVAAFDGSEAVMEIEKIREAYPDMPLIWISEDSSLGIAAYQNHVTSFVDKNAFENQIQNALEVCGTDKRKIV